jgi:hypothetical protein
LDTYGNLTVSAYEDIVYSQLAHLSDPGFSRIEPDTAGYFFARYLEQTSPEQGKYTALLGLTYDNPTEIEEFYSYIPSLRRALRLSEFARCAPLFGTDLNWDDADEGPPALPQLFKIDYIGIKKVLSLVHATSGSFDTCGDGRQLPPKYYYAATATAVPFPAPDSGAWDPRDVYVISMERLPRFARGYCYGKRVLYIDTETHFPLHTDLYDAAGKLYKTLISIATPHELPQNDGSALMTIGSNVAFVVNFQDEHATIFLGLHVCANHQCDRFGDWLNARRYASPAGLSMIVQ